jgi:hypothetical protein
MKVLKITGLDEVFDIEQDPTAQSAEPAEAQPED